MSATIHLILLLTFCIYRASSEVSYRQTVKELIEITKSRDLSNEFMDAYRELLKENIPDTPEIPKEDIDLAFRVFNKYFTLEYIIDLYSTALSQEFPIEDIIEYIQFYKTPLGDKFIQNSKKMISVMIQVIKQLMEDVKSHMGEIMTQFKILQFKRKMTGYLEKIEYFNTLVKSLGVEDKEKILDISEGLGSVKKEIEKDMKQIEFEYM